MPLHVLGAITVAALLHSGSAQQFSGLPLPPSWPGISSSCVNALNTTVNCASYLGVVSIDNKRLNSTLVQPLCVPSCLSSLNSVRQTIQQGCTNTSDVIQFFDGNTYPATFIVDRFLYTYNLACRVDKVTGQFCDPMLISWLNQNSPLTAAQNCSDCMLGASQTQLNSPFGYDDNLAQDFQSLTSSCAATGYAFTSPGPYTLSASTTSTSVSNASTTSSTAVVTPCTNSYTVQSGDTCNSIAQNQNVSTYAVISSGGLLSDCSNLVPGAVLCLGATCNIYLVQPSDTCNSIIAAQNNGTSAAQFLAWNPNINTLCGNLYGLKGTYICVSSPGGPLGKVSVTTALAVSTPASAAPQPTNAPSQSNSNCGRWYTIQDGDYCDKVSVQFSIALKDFYFLNPEINTNCTNLLLGLAYCVQAVGNIATYSGYPTTSQYFTLTSAAYSTAAPNATSNGSPVATPLEAQLPTAAGTIAGCSDYRNYVPVPGIIDQSQASDISTITSYINNCTFIAGSYGIALSDLLAWNPSLGNGSCSLQPGYSYCVSRNSTDQPIVYSKSCLPVDHTQSGTIASCNCFTQVYAYDNGSYTCAAVAEDFSITVNNIMTWNPWVGSNCDTGLYSGLNSTNYNAVCVGVNSTAPVSSTSVPSPTTSTSSATVGPTQSGIAANCTKYYTVKSGDSCASIQYNFTITFAQFYAWNPAIGSNCQSLFLGYAYCVAVPSSTPSSASPATSSAAPTQSGTASGCTTYYTVQSGDSCTSIQTKFNITFATLYKWNPGIGSSCQSLFLGYSECVAGGP